MYHFSLGTLIKLVGSDRFKSLLKDKTSKKKNVWAQIAKEMMTLGYNFGNRDPGTVCSQKWRNMEGKIITFIQNGGPKSTGAGKLKKPVFYDDIRDVIDSAKVTPVNLMDTMSDLPGQTPSSSSVTSGSSRSNNQETSFSAKDSDELLSDDEAKELTSNQKKDSEDRKTQNKNLVQLLTKKMEQEKESKKQMLEVLSKLFDK